MGLKLVLAFGQTVTDTGFMSHCFKQCITVFISLMFLYKLPESIDWF